MAITDTAAYEVECETARLSATTALARLAGSQSADGMPVQLGQTYGARVCFRLLSTCSESEVDACCAEGCTQRCGTCGSAGLTESTQLLGTMQPQPCAETEVQRRCKHLWTAYL